MIRASGKSRTYRAAQTPAGSGGGRRRAASVKSAPYVHGSAAPARDFWEESVPVQDNIPVETRIAVRSNRESFMHMTPRLVLYFLGMTILMASMLVWYIKLRSDITTSTNEIVALETQLSEMRSDNDEELKAIEQSIDLEAIREKAVKEMGMKYATRDQIVEYTDWQEETVHQVADIER